MLKQIITTVTSALTEAGVPEVYSSFDAASPERMGRGIFTVVGIGRFESSTPVYSEYTMYLPFKAEVTIDVTAPERWNVARLYDYYGEKLEPALRSFSGMTSSVAGITIRHDSNISRLVLSVKLCVSGITRIERSTE